MGGRPLHGLLCWSGAPDVSYVPHYQRDLDRVCYDIVLIVCTNKVIELT